MTNLAIVAIAIAITAFFAAASIVLTYWWRDKRRAKRENAVAQAAKDYLARFEVRARIVAVTLPDQRIVLMVETQPHKKLRFSYIIEQPIKQYVLKQTNVEIDRMFWRFPLPPKSTQAPDVQYGGVTPQPMPKTAESSKITKASLAQDDEDDYFKRQAYKIEEVSWEDFSSASKSGTGQGPSEKG